jgi:hypothetical protein
LKSAIRWRYAEILSISGRELKFKVDELVPSWMNKAKG